MKISLLFAILAAALYFYLRNSTPTPVQAVAGRPADKIAASQTIVIAAAPSYRDRWNTGPNAQTDLKTGPNAQTDFEPFAPTQQSTWKRTPGYTVVAGKLRVR